MPRIPFIPIGKRFQWFVPAVPYYLILAGYNVIYTLFQEYKLSWPESLLFFHSGDRCSWYSRQKETNQNGIKAVEEVFGENGRLRNMPEYYNKCVKLLEHEDKQIKRGKLKKLNNQELIRYYLKYLELNRNYWHGATMPELISYGAGFYLEQEIPKIYPADNAGEVINILTSADDFSFFQKEEINLLKIIAQLKANIKETVIAKNQKDFIARVNDKHPNIMHMLDKHATEYDWILNNYATGRPLSASYFYKRLDSHMNSNDLVK